MFQMIISLSNIDYKEDLFLALQSVGIQKATTFEAQSMDKSLESEYSLFQGFLNSETAREGQKTLVLCTISSLDLARELVKNLSAAGIPLDEGSILQFSVVPIALEYDGEFREA